MIKLNLIFIVMDLLSLLAYPIIFAHGKLRQFARSRENSAPANVLATGSVEPVTVK